MRHTVFGDAHLDWGGNITFAVGLVAVMVAITYGIQSYGGHSMGVLSDQRGAGRPRGDKADVIEPAIAKNAAPATS